MIRVLRWIGLVVGGLAGLVALGVGGLYLLTVLSRLPHDHRTVWIDGPGDARIRSHSWVEGGNWMEDPRERHEYTLVPNDGTETLIGEGPAPLDSEGVRLYEHGNLAELVVSDIAFRRTPSGSWARFHATDNSFIRRHYAPFADHSIHYFGRSWRSAYTGLGCRIAAVDLVSNRMVSACGSGRRSVRLVFSRPSFEDPWAIDRTATLEETPPPERTAFPETARATLTALRVVPAKDLSALPVENHRLDATLREAGVELVRQLDLEILRDERTEIALETRAFRDSWWVEGGWIAANGWPVVFWGDWELRAQPWGEATLVHHSFVPRDDASYLVYLELRPSESD